MPIFTDVILITHFIFVEFYSYHASYCCLSQKHIKFDVSYLFF